MSDAALTIERKERKRLGQYFTGEPLARVLAALADANAATSLIDPMAGSGDMLAGALGIGATARMSAVEIDPAAAGQCRERLSKAGTAVEVRTADAFMPSTWSADTGVSWDLVITNPPYVRYQRSTRASAGRVTLPSATDIRRGLHQIAEERAALSSDERKVFRSLIAGYSGLADQAVPSWLLCALLVARGGRLAMVVPDTWLSRDYAVPVLYLLRRYFEIEHIVEDGEAAWFEDALVRTTLVVARRRVTARTTAVGVESTRHVHARLTPIASDDRSLVGALHPRSKEPERRFAASLHSVLRSSSPLLKPGLEVQVVDDASLRDRLLSQVQALPWTRELESTQRATVSEAEPSVAELPRKMRSVVGNAPLQLRTLADLGWRVGQGLRTGANRFFYCELLTSNGHESEVRFDNALSCEPLVVPNGLLRVVVRKQSDLTVAEGNLACSPGRVLILDGHALEEDIANATGAGVVAPYQPIPQPLADLVRRAAHLNVGDDDEPRLLSDLSAVVTNVRLADPARPDRAPRFWYQLPPLAERHTPALSMPRINHGHPVPRRNSDAVVVDANFSTFWPSREGALPAAGFWALLCSSWTRAVLESAGTVLGGGALKIEATQLRRVPLPPIDSSAASELARLGALLCGPAEARAAAHASVDALVWRILGVAERVRRAAEDISADLLGARNPRLARAP
ncbi:MAG: N-6 DNA methylase [Thermoanaerobaculia bacterium]